jgi:hypothetical protein
MMEDLNPLELEEYEYHWAVSDISGFVVKYGLDRVIQDVLNFIDAQEALSV